MDCRDVARLLPEYLDDALAEPGLGELEAHLLTCGTCSAFVDQIRSTIAAARHLGTPMEQASAYDEILRLYERWKKRRPPGA